ncbi:MAG: DUF488 domain-containing protein [Ignavibacteriaceae bacterium]|nr:DUF488 domain-containing protein [Ignavibacteriaceae bacterium]
MNNSNKKLFTIGHSRHEIDHFIHLLKKHSINCLIDVRSHPYSRIAPQFNKESLANSLKVNNIIYLHFEKEFGARQTDASLIDLENKVDYSRIRETKEFKEGTKRVFEGLEKGYNIALMCSEANPFDCHRFVMIAYYFVKEGVIVNHILKDGSIVDNSELEKELLKKYSKILPTNDLFTSDVTDKLRLELAYRLRNRDIAFTAAETDVVQPVEISD